jgi:2-dehydro-3-deoxyphosphogluconate aldolase/(4S)-4-hydroxy-2-oxoglutarate aldolase
MQEEPAEGSSSKEIQKRIVERIEKERIIILLTGRTAQSVIEAYMHLRENGLNLVGVDFRIQGIKDRLKSFKKKGQRNLGVFSISTKKEARVAINAGAVFLFSTHVDRGIIKRCRKEGIFHAAGSLTPGEVFSTQDLGADSASLLPCGKMGGLDWFLFLKGIFPGIKLIPTDTMSPFEASEYLRAGAYAVAPIIDLERLKEPYKLIGEFMVAK